MSEEAKNSQLKKIVELKEITCGPIGALNTDPGPEMHRWSCQVTRRRPLLASQQTSLDEPTGKQPSTKTQVRLDRRHMLHARTPGLPGFFRRGISSNRMRASRHSQDQGEILEDTQRKFSNCARTPASCAPAHPSCCARCGGAHQLSQ